MSSLFSSYGRGQQIAKYVFIFYPKHTRISHELSDKQEHLLDFSELRGTVEGIQTTTQWVMQ
jgi:hypothetical protein